MANAWQFSLILFLKFFFIFVCSRAAIEIWQWINETQINLWMIYYNSFYQNYKKKILLKNYWIIHYWNLPFIFTQLNKVIQWSKNRIIFRTGNLFKIQNFWSTFCHILRCCACKSRNLTQNLPTHVVYFTKQKIFKTILIRKFEPDYWFYMTLLHVQNNY